MSSGKSDNRDLNPGKKKESFNTDRYTTVFTVMLFLLLALALFAGYIIWNGYRNQIMDNHKEQLLLTSHTLANNMELSLEEYCRNLDFLSSQQEEAGSFDKSISFFREYLKAKTGMEEDILLMASGRVRSVRGTVIEKQQEVSRVNDRMTVWLATDTEGKHLFIFRKKLPGGDDICLAIDADRCYEKWISGIKIGTSGYIMVKNSSGIILMHPQESQWGIHVISGRKEMFPDLDLDSLENMVNTQNKGGEGLSEYYSYWWMEEPLVRVRKISGYAAAKLGEDFWVISSVVDYDDFSAPIEMGFSRIAILFTVCFLSAVALLLFVNRLLADRTRSRQEIATLRAMNERLEEIHRVEERIAHQQRLQVIGTMTGGIAHEFNNLLTPIMGFSELLLMELPEDSDAYDNVLEIYDASEKATEVVRQISTLSRRNVETVFKRQNARSLLRKACKMMRSICPSNIRLDEDFSIPEESVLLCNSTQVNQVLLNLCVNAIHAIRVKELGKEKDERLLSGTKSNTRADARADAKADAKADIRANAKADTRADIRADAKADTRADIRADKTGLSGDSATAESPNEGHILVRAEIISSNLLRAEPLLENREVPGDWENYLRICVSDNGCGMNAEVLRQIFDPFFTTKKLGEGTGLGLTLAEQIIISHRGYIYAQSRPGEGSDFMICLPMMDADTEVPESIPESGQTKHIIIADDNAKILDMLSKNFSRLDVDVDTCRTRKNLRDMLEEKQEDVLLIDESLEDGDGIDFCMSIQGKYPSMLKIVMADYPTHALLEAKQHKIIDGYLLKPVSHTDALEEIRRCSTPSGESFI
ncbi:MAG: response regulator [Lachnospiraceae bacterium]|nr:response regulator [Lachnospiraceae bacterium]